MTLSEHPPAAQPPLPVGVLMQVSPNAWGACEICGDVYPVAAMLPDDDQLPICRGCWILIEARHIVLTRPGERVYAVTERIIAALACKYNVKYDTVLTE